MVATLARTEAAIGGPIRAQEPAATIVQMETGIMQENKAQGSTEATGKQGFQRIGEQQRKYSIRVVHSVSRERRKGTIVMTAAQRRTLYPALPNKTL
jgi:hypothetical protein